MERDTQTEAQIESDTPMDTQREKEADTQTE